MTKMSRSEIEAKVTDTIIEALEQGVVPWQKPWTGADGRAKSLSSKKHYRGINTLVLDAAAILGGFSSPWWGTYKQIKALGGNVRKGEQGTAIVLWKVFEKEQEDGTTKRIPMLRYFTVFNADQADGLELPEEDKGEPVEVAEAVQDVLARYEDGPKVTHRRGDRAFYSPDADAITLPELDQFHSETALVATMFHELIHSTGHSSRLDRLEGGSFGCESYAQEELVAEMGAAMLAATVGIEVEISNSASYVASWLKVLKNDRSLLIKAAQQAQKAVDRVYPATQELSIAA